MKRKTAGTIGAVQMEPEASIVLLVVHADRELS